MEELASARGIPFQAPIESAYVIEPKTHRIQDRVFNVEKKACVALFLLLFQSSAERERESVCVCVSKTPRHMCVLSTANFLSLPPALPLQDAAAAAKHSAAAAQRTCARPRQLADSSRVSG